MVSLIEETRMEKNIEHDMETGTIQWFMGIREREVGVSS